MKDKTVITDWLFYWGSKDERIRASCDKAGHVAFWCFVVVNLGLGFFFINSQQIDHIFAARLILLSTLIPLLAYIVVVISKGVTVLERKAQKRGLIALLCVFPFFTAFIAWLFLYLSHGGKAVSIKSWIAILAVAIVGTVLAALLIVLIEALSRKRAGKLSE
jgi:cytochrome bd-type quinol oxidase subunit 2